VGGGGVGGGGPKLARPSASTESQIIHNFVRTCEIVSYIGNCYLHKIIHNS
jgi:hypothetical protein